MTEDLAELSKEYQQHFGKPVDALYLLRTLGLEEALATLRRAIQSGKPLGDPDYSNCGLI